ncbi:MAG: hypothetical protein GAK44_00159 [Pseudomonas delhiensis]|nr:MAG: hypothetical protein GAK44_00159 [Pseudomonas delhiensis]
MIIDSERLLAVLPNARPVAGVFVPALNQALAQWRIDTPARAAAFLAQVGHESAQFTRLEENLVYSAQRLADVWPRRFRGSDGSPNEQARALAYQPEAIANRVYAGRNGNGDEVSGDGWRFRGRGLLQVTGRSNYRAVGQALQLPLLDSPQRLLDAPAACQSAAWWWQAHGLNALADAGDFEAITRTINGGLAGQDERLRLWRKAQAVLV